MAMITDIATGEHAATNPQIPEKRKPGRPKKNVNVHASSAGPDQSDNISIEEATRLAAQSDWQIHLVNLTEDDWSHRLCYLTRLAPTTEKRSAGRKIATATYARSFTLEDLKKEHGSGVYRLRFLIVSQPSGQYHKYRDDFVDINDPKYPPNLPYGEWVDRPENESWKWAGPLLRARDEANAAELGVSPAAGNPGSGYPPGFSMDKVYDRAEQGFRTAFEMARTLAPAPKDDGPLTALLTKLIEISLTRPEPKPDNSMALVVELLRSDLKEAREEMRELRKVAPTQQNNPLTQLKEWKPLITEFVEVFAQKTGNQPWWAGPLEKLMDGVGEAIPTVVQMVNRSQQQQPQVIQPRLPNAQQAQVPAPVTVTPVPADPQQSSPTPEPVVVELTDEQREQQRVQAIYQKWGGFVVHIIPQMIEHFKIDEDGHGGLHFRDWCLRMHGELRWSDLRREIGAPLLVSMIGTIAMNNPQIGSDMAPAEAVQIFCQEFFVMPEQEDDDESDEEGVPNAA